MHLNRLPPQIKLIPLHSVRDGRAKRIEYENSCTMITKYHCRHALATHSLAAVLGSKTPRQVPAALKYLRMILVTSYSCLFTVLRFALFLSESTTLCLSPHPSPSDIGSNNLLYR